MINIIHYYCPIPSIFFSYYRISFFLDHLLSQPSFSLEKIKDLVDYLDMFVDFTTLVADVVSIIAPMGLQKLILRLVSTSLIKLAGL